MIAKNPYSHLLEQSQYKYSLQDVEEPNLYREIYSYDEIPKIAFNHRRVPLNTPEHIWITDTTFRDGQQSRAPYTPEQIVGRLAYACGLQTEPAARTPAQLLPDFDWAKIPRQDICLPEGLF